jgi:hypothetical protein
MQRSEAHWQANTRTLLTFAARGALDGLYRLSLHRFSGHRCNDRLFNNCHMVHCHSKAIIIIINQHYISTMLSIITSVRYRYNYLNYWVLPIIHFLLTKMCRENSCVDKTVTECGISFSGPAKSRFYPRPRQSVAWTTLEILPRDSY